MSVIHHPLKDETNPGATGKCQVCRNPSSGYWMATDGVHYEVCGPCAVQKLPLLIADSIYLSADSPALDAEAALVKVTAAFWRGVTHRLSAKKKA